PGGDEDRSSAAWDPERVEPGSVAGLLARLVDRSLVVADQADLETSALRYRLLETGRRDAAERPADPGQAAVRPAGQRHAAYFTALAEQATPHLLGHGQRDWLRRIALEHDNFRAALEWGRAQGDGAGELRLAAALGRYWHLHGPSSEGRAWLRHAL